MIIHSPIISGSLTFADGATFTMPDNGVYSGSFSGSYFGDTFTGGAFIGDGSSLTFGGTGLVSGSSQVEFNDVNNTPFSQSAGSVTVSKSIIPTSATIDLGTPSNPFRDVYISSASLYIDGTQVISSNTSELIITTDVNQSLKLVETGADTVQIQTENGDITLTSTGTGNIELDAPIQIVAGNQILSSDGNAIQFGEDLSITGNITLTGTVDGIDLQAFSGSVASDFAGLSTDYNDLQNIPAGIVSGSSQVTELLPSGVVSGSIQVNADSITNFDVNVKDKINADGVISGSSQVNADTITNFDTNVKDKLNSDGVFSGSAQIISLPSVDTDDLSEGLTNLYYTDSRVKLKLDTEGVISGSSQLPDGIVSGSSQILTLVSIDEDTMATNSDTKLPTQQSVKAYVDTKVSALVDSAPGTLDTLNELAAALGDDPNFATTISTNIAGKVSQSLEIIAGNGLTGGGNLTTNRTLNVGAGTGVTVTADAISIGQAVGTGDTVQFAKVGVGGASDATYELKVTGDIGATGDIVAYVSSDERLKDNIELISDPIGKVQSLKGVTWEWNENASEAAKQSPNLGVIAQDVEKVLPQLVHDRENGFKGVDYAKLTGLLIEAIKEQQKQIDDLKSKLG